MKLLLLLPTLLLIGCTQGFTTFTPQDVASDNKITLFNHSMILSGNSSEFTHVATVAPYVLNNQILRATGFAHKGSTAYIVYNTEGDTVRGGLDIISISSLSAPTLQSSVVSQTSEYAEVKVKDDYVYMVGQKKSTDGRNYGLLTVMNVSNPSQPVVASELEFQDGYYATSIDIEGTTAYITVPNVGVKEVNISNPQAVSLQTTRNNVLGNSLFTRRHQGKSIVLGGSQNHQVSIIDNTHSVDAFMISAIPQEAPSRMFIKNNILYSNSAGRLTILDLTNDVYQPQLKSHIQIAGRGNGLTQQSCVAYLAQGEKGLQVYNVANKDLPVLMGAFDYADSQDDSGSANNTYLMQTGMDNYVFVSDGIGGVKIVKAETQVSGCQEDQVVVSGLMCKVYDLSSTQPSSVPNFAALTSIGSFVAPQLDVMAQDSSLSFPYFPQSLQHLTTWYGIVCEGDFKTTVAGASNIHLTSDDGSKLYINGNLAIDNDGLHGPHTVSTTFNGVVGQTNHFKIEYFQGPPNLIQLELRIDGSYPAQYMNGFTHIQ